MLVAAGGAAILGDWAEGALLLSCSAWDIRWNTRTMNKARRSIAALSSLAPTSAIIRNGNETEVLLSEIVVGDIIVVKSPMAKIAADGVVIKEILP